MQQRQSVILIHGLISSSLLLRPLARRIRKHGFDTRFWSYLSLRGSIDTHAERLIQFIENQQLSNFHLVAHSMGSIICRRALLDLSPNLVDRFVMLAPPNQGSHVATRFSKALGRICPALDELSDRSDSYVRKLGIPSGIETGIVGANGDLVVRPSSLSLGNEIDTVSFPGMHSQLLLRSDAAESVANFLRTGSFNKATVYQEDLVASATDANRS
jgi:pimeloyl-ACP methyl ester carboxylesterase